MQVKQYRSPLRQRQRECRRFDRTSRIDDEILTAQELFKRSCQRLIIFNEQYSHFCCPELIRHTAPELATINPIFHSSDLNGA